MPKRTPKKPTAVFRLHVELEEVAPPVWRVVLVPSNITLAALHTALNAAMGWTNSHLHQFCLGDRTFGDVTMSDEGELELELELEDEQKFHLDQLIGVGQHLVYEYDFGDGWTHHVEVGKQLEFDPRLAYPLCVAGARACPPEDCGGPPGYEHLVAALQDEDDEEHDDLVTWVGGHFDSEGFDVNRTNAALRERCR